MNTRTYILIGCNPECRHRLPDRQETESHINPKTRKRVETVLIIPQCAHIANCAARREEIYNRAQAASDAAFERCMTVHGKVRAMERAWRKVADEYTEQPCPFFEP